MPGVGYFSFFAIASGSLAFVHLRYPSKVRGAFDRLATIFGASKYVAGYREPYDRMVGGIYAACALLMGIAAVLSAT